MLKFELYKKAPLFFLQKFVIVFISSNQPVVPETTGIFNFKLFNMFSLAALGVLKFIETSAFDISPFEKFFIYY